MRRKATQTRSSRGREKTVTRVTGFFKKHRYAAAAFFLPALILVIAFAVTGVYPFGEDQITIIDMYHQYVPFLSELQYKLQHGGSLLYSWNGAAGYNFWALTSYYAASPLNLLLVFFPPGLIVEGVTFILVLKVGFSGMFQYLYLKRTYPRTADLPQVSRAADNWAGVAFGTMYALSAYFLGYFWCIMWIDVMALLPLCMLGLRRLVNEGRPVMYSVSLALIIICNYYIAIMVCIFTVLYYLVIYFEKPREGGAKKFISTTAIVALYSVIGAAIACIRFFPTWRAMKNAYYFADQMPEEWSFYNDPLEIVNQLLPNAHLCFREGLPNLYCGLFVVIMLVFFFVSKTISLRVKFVNGLLLGFMFLSLNINKLDFIWHGLHFPNELPYRYSFVISFVLVGLAYQAYLRLPQISRKTMMAALAGLLGYYLLAAHVLEGSLDNKEEYFYIGVGLLLLYGLILILHREGKLTHGNLSGLLVFVLVCELICTTSISFDRAGSVIRDDYLSDREGVEKLLNPLRDEFVRVEKTDGTVINMPALYHYRGVSQFSSSINAKATELMEKIGVEGEPGRNRYNYVFTTPVINAMLNIKYIIAEEEPSVDGRFKKIDSNKTATLYENTQPLSIGYMLPESIRTWETLDTNPFTVQNDFVRAATDGKVDSVFESVERVSALSDDVEVMESDGGSIETMSEDGVAGILTLNYKADKAGDYYVFVEADQAETINIFRDNSIYKSITEDCGAVVHAGKMKAGEEFDIEIDYEEGGQGMVNSKVYRLDEEAWNMAYVFLSKDMMEVTDFGDTFVEGVVEPRADGIFTTSILYEKGWTLYVDGEKEEIGDLIGDDFISVPLDAGRHEIRLRYIPEGFIPGVILTICGILALAALEILRRRRDKKAQRAGVAAAVGSAAEAAAEPVSASVAPAGEEPVYDFRDLP